MIHMKIHAANYLYATYTALIKHLESWDSYCWLYITGLYCKTMGWDPNRGSLVSTGSWSWLGHWVNTLANILLCSACRSSDVLRWYYKGNNKNSSCDVCIWIALIFNQAPKFLSYKSSNTRLLKSATAHKSNERSHLSALFLQQWLPLSIHLVSFRVATALMVSGTKGLWSTANIAATLFGMTCAFVTCITTLLPDNHKQYPFGISFRLATKLHAEDTSPNEGDSTNLGIKYPYIIF